MYLSNLTNGGATPALAKVMAFNERRLGVIAENVANATTPNYRAKQLDPRAFQQSLKRAIDQRGTDKNVPFVIDRTDQVYTDEKGILHVTPTEQPVRNVLFHDGTNNALEREMADLAETVMAHETAATLLRGNIDGLKKAIRGTVG